MNVIKQNVNLHIEIKLVENYFTLVENFSICLETAKNTCSQYRFGSVCVCLCV